MRSSAMTRRSFLQTAGGLAALGSVTVHAAPVEPGTAVTPHFQWLRLGQVKPAGWIKAQLLMDLREGFAGRLDQLAPAEVASDIFASGRNRPNQSNRPTAHSAWSHTWWNGESEGNWRTGYIMMAYLADEADARSKADAYVQHILQAQDRDGYMGVYSPQLRYSQSPDNGELWTQACLMRGLVAYYELSGKTEVLNAVQRAARLTMSSYGPGKQTAFAFPTAGGGVGHGLMFVDVLERLHDLTGNPAYRDFGLWLYQDFCAGIPPRFQDGTLASLLDLSKPWENHGAHTYEFMRVPLWAYSVSGKPDLKQAYENAFTKIRRYTYPSGAAVSMESIEGRQPDPTTTLYEYCAMKEMLASFTSGLQKTGHAELGDRIERLIFNAAQGARAARGQAITYCTCDNRYRVDGGLGRRHKFSPVHADVAVCCNPNATQIMSHYIRAMWMRSSEQPGLAATLYGPGTVQTAIRGVRVRVDEETLYPFSPEVDITVAPEEAVEFPLFLRNPGWSGNTNVSCAGASIQREGDYFVVRKRWQKGDQVRVSFRESNVSAPAVNGEVAVQRGPLLYALPIPSEQKTTKTYSVPGFIDSEDFPTAGAQWSYALRGEPSHSDSGLTAKPGENVDMLHPFEGVATRLEANLIDLDTGKPVPVTLIPMGTSRAVLRRETFPVKGSSST